MQEINGFPGYFVAREGKVFYNKNKGEMQEKKQHNHNGYRRINVTIGNKKKNLRVHRLVAEAFIPNPNNLPEVNHIDEDKSNNHVDNLEWVTASQNQQHSAYQQAKLYILENKNGKQFEVFNLEKWCRENKMNKGSLHKTYKGKQSWHKNHRLVSIRELSTEERRARMLDAMITSTTE